MRLFGPLYEVVIKWSRHPHAVRYLGGLSVAEASFFPIPPDALLIPMVIARRDRAWYFALLTTIASTIGGVFGYLIGSILYDQVGIHVLEAYQADERFKTITHWFDSYGIWIILIAGFTPIPYKLFTITAGILSMSLFPFVLCSLVGRGARFFLISALIFWGGVRFERLVKKYVEVIGWVVVAVLIIGYIVIGVY